MTTIYKYIISSNAAVVAMPEDAYVLSTAFQGKDLCIWARVDTDIKEIESRTFRVFGTGHPIPQDMGLMYDFIGTAFMDNGLVFHVFELE